MPATISSVQEVVSSYQLELELCRYERLSGWEHQSRPSIHVQALTKCLLDAGVFCSDHPDLGDTPGYLASSPTYKKAVVSRSLDQRHQLEVYAHLLAHVVLDHIPEGFYLHIEHLDGWEPLEVALDPIVQRQEEEARFVVETILDWRSENKSAAIQAKLKAIVLRGRRHGIQGDTIRALQEVFQTPIDPTLWLWHRAKARLGYKIAVLRRKTEGYLVQRESAPENEIYIIENGVLRQITDLRTPYYRGKKRSDIRLVTKQEFEKLPKGKPIRFARLVRCRECNDIYVLEDGTKRHVPTVQIFEDCGFSMWDVVGVGHAKLERVPCGAAISIGDVEETSELTEPPVWDR